MMSAVLRTAEFLILVCYQCLKQLSRVVCCV